MEILITNPDGIILKMDRPEDAGFHSHMNGFCKRMHKSLWQIDDSYDGIEIDDADNRAERWRFPSFVRMTKAIR